MLVEIPSEVGIPVLELSVSNFVGPCIVFPGCVGDLWPDMKRVTDRREFHVALGCRGGPGVAPG